MSQPEPRQEPPRTEPWSKARVEELLAREDFRYQNVELPYGLSTGGDDRSATARAIFPDDMTGKTVLDIGCRFGYFSFEAIKRGATRVLGVDVDPDGVRKARLLAECLGYDVEFRLLNVETDVIDESFDYILALNLLHHLQNPLAVLQKLITMTRETLVLEVAGLGPHDGRKLGLSRLKRFFIGNAPTIYVAPAGTSRKSSDQKFYITNRALENLLFFQRNCFARLRSQQSEHKGRFLLQADKRHIEDLVIVAGPSSSGKSTLMRELEAGQHADLNKALGMDDGAEWPRWNAFDLVEPQDPHMKRVCFHYDTLRPFKRSAQVHARDEAMDILACAERTKVVTIWNEPEHLKAMFEEAVMIPKTRRGKFRGNKRKVHIHRMYQDRNRVVNHYRLWFEFLRSRGIESMVVSPRDGMRLMTLTEWEAEVGDAAPR